MSRGAATTREGRMKPHARENHGPQPNCRRPSVHQQNAREKTPVHAHGANNHTMDTTGTYNPLKLSKARTYMETLLRTVSIRRKKEMRHNSSDAVQKTRTQQQIWSTNPHIKSNFLPLVKHNCVTIERRTLTKTHRTSNIRHMRQTKKTAATLRR